MPQAPRRTAAWLALALASGLAAPAWAGPTGMPDAEMKRALRQAAGAADSFPDRFAAQVWLTDMSYRLAPLMPSPDKRAEFLRLVHAEATRAGLEPELVLSVIEIESRFDRFAVSYAGAVGLMQIMPFWLKEIGRPGDNLFDMRTNLRMGCTILKIYLTRERGDVIRALARYNGSYGSPQYPTLVLSAFNRRWTAL